MQENSKMRLFDKAKNMVIEKMKLWNWKTWIMKDIF